MRGKDRNGNRGTREVLTGGRGRKRKSEKGREGESLKPVWKWPEEGYRYMRGTNIYKTHLQREFPTADLSHSI